MHRIGFHFPTTVVAEVCAHYGIVLSAAGTLVTDENVEDFRKRRQNDRGTQRLSPDRKKNQVTINTEARDSIRDLFPNIPDNDLHQIIKHAFQAGQKKVGTANELTLIRRAQLSVVAHVRHVYTHYDRLLKEVGYSEARKMVETPTLRKLVEWRGDDDTGKQSLEDVFREVIVISDDEHSDQEQCDRMMDVDDTGVEVTLHRADNRQIELQPVNYIPTSSFAVDRFHLLEDDAPSVNHYLNHKIHQERTDPETEIRHGRSRYEAWNRAYQKYRSDAGPATSTDSHHGAPRHEPDIPTASTPHSLHVEQRLDYERLRHDSGISARDRCKVSNNSTALKSNQMQGLSWPSTPSPLTVPGAFYC